MNLTGLKMVALTLLENHEKIAYYNFLESLKKASPTEETKILVESAQKGFGIVFEAELDGEDEKEVEVSEAPVKEQKSVNPAFKAYVSLSNKLKDGLQAKFRGGNGAKETKKMVDVIKEGKGSVKAKTLHSFRDFDVITDYEYTPDVPSTEQDKKNARNVLISSALPMWVYLGAQIGRTPGYEEAGQDFIAGAVGGVEGSKAKGSQPANVRLQNFLDSYQEGRTFFSWDKLALNQLRMEMIAKAEGTTRSANVWNKEKSYPANTTVNHGKRNWKSLQEVPAGEEPGVSNSYWTPIEKRLDEMSLDAPISATGDDDDTVSVGETVASEEHTAADTETMATLNKLMAKLPPGEKTDRFKKILDLHYKQDKGMKEIGEELGVSAAMISNYMKDGMEMLRSLGKVPA